MGMENMQGGATAQVRGPGEIEKLLESNKSLLNVLADRMVDLGDMISPIMSENTPYPSPGEEKESDPETLVGLELHKNNVTIKHLIDQVDSYCARCKL